MRKALFIILIPLLIPLAACDATYGVTDVGLPERDGEPDLSTISQVLRDDGGPVFIWLTGAANDEVVADLSEVGLYDILLFSASLAEVVGGKLPPNTVDAVAAKPYVTAIEDASAGADLHWELYPDSSGGAPNN